MVFVETNTKYIVLHMVFFKATQLEIFQYLCLEPTSTSHRQNQVVTLKLVIDQECSTQRLKSVLNYI